MSTVRSIIAKEYNAYLIGQNNAMTLVFKDLGPQISWKTVTTYELSIHSIGISCGIFRTYCYFSNLESILKVDLWSQEASNSELEDRFSNGYWPLYEERI